jgi:hypothetical protein
MKEIIKIVYFVSEDWDGSSTNMDDLSNTLTII